MSSSQSSFPELPTIETCEAAILCARIFSPQSSTNFTRNPLFAALFSLVLAAVIDYGETLATCRKIDQHANHILLTFSADKSGIRDVYAAAQSIKNVCRDKTRHFQEAAALPVRAAAAADCGTLQYSAAYAKHRLFGDDIRLGEVQERALLLAKVAGTQHFPDSLFTHAMYQKLPKNLRSKFPQKYYHDHICCYGEPIPPCTAQHGTYSESCGIARFV